MRVILLLINLFLIAILVLIFPVLAKDFKRISIFFQRLAKDVSGKSCEIQVKSQKFEFDGFL